MSGLESAPGSCSFHYSLSQTAIFSWVSYKAYVSAGSIDNISVHALAMCEICLKEKWKIPTRRYFSISHETCGFLMTLEGIKNDFAMMPLLLTLQISHFALVFPVVNLNKSFCFKLHMSSISQWYCQMFHSTQIQHIHQDKIWNWLFLFPEAYLQPIPRSMIETFCEISYCLKAVTYFYQKLHHRYLIGL